MIALEQPGLRLMLIKFIRVVNYRNWSIVGISWEADHVNELDERKHRSRLLESDHSVFIGC